MRLCFFCQEDVIAPQGGTGTYVRHVSRALAARGHDVHVIVRQVGHAPVNEMIEGVSVYRVPAPGPSVIYSPVFFRRARQKFLELHRQHPFTALHGNLPLLSSWGVRGPDIPPVIETVHCTVGEEMKAQARASLRNLNLNELIVRAIAPVWLSREKVLLKRASQVIAVSAGLKRELVEQNGCLPARVTVIPNGIEYSWFARNSSPDRGRAIRRQLGIGHQELVILYLGRLMERKRVIDLVRAMPQVLASLPQARLVVVGKQTHNAALLVQTAQALGVANHLTLVDHIAYRDVPAYYGMADAYALPSAYEGFPFTVLEAMASGTPVVASAIPGIDEQIVPEQTGLMHPVGDVEAIALQLIRLLSDKALASRLARAARDLVRTNYSWDRIGELTEESFMSVL